MRFHPVFLAVMVLLCQQAEPRAWATAEHGQNSMFEQLDSNGDGLLERDEISGEKQLLFERLLRTSDGDGDGKLSLVEFEESLQVRRQKKPLVEKAPGRLPGADGMLLLLAMCDANGDGVITPDEPPENLDRFYQFLRSRLGGENKDRINVRQAAQIAPQLTRIATEIVERQDIDVEFEYALLSEKSQQLIQRLDRPQRPGEALADPQRAQALFRRLDANGDGQVDYEEIPEGFADRFDNLLKRADQNGDEKISEAELQRISERIRAFTEFRQRKEEKQKAANKRAQAKRKQSATPNPRQGNPNKERRSKPEAQESGSKGE